MANVLKDLAKAVNKPENQYRFQEFENADGGYSVAIVDNESGSITLQANSGSAGDAKKRLEEAVEAGNYVFLDPAIPPKVETKTVPDAPVAKDTDESKSKAAETNAQRAQIVRENNTTIAEAGLVTDGYAVLNDGGQGVGTTGTSTATADKRGVEKAKK